MNLHKLLLTNNPCYKAGKKLNVKGIMVHSTGANNPNLKRYVGPDDGLLGKNQYGNHWNNSKLRKCAHAFIGKLADGTIATYQTLPWNMRGWHGASGPKGSVNNTHIGFEICEGRLTDEEYFNKVYKEAAELCAYLCKEFKLNPLADGVLICHSEGYARGIASNHADVMHWFPKHGKNMDTFRAYVNELLEGSSVTPVEPKPEPELKPPVVVNPPTETEDTAKTIWNYLKGKGLNDYAVAGIMGNLYVESALRPTNLQNAYEKRLGMDDATYTAAVDDGSYTNFVRDSAGYGLAQWTYWSRKQNLLDYAKQAGKSIGDLGMQLNFLWHELQMYTSVMNMLKGATSVRQASDVIITRYEKPADQSESAKARRASCGEGYYKKFAGTTTTTEPKPEVEPETKPEEVFEPYKVRVSIKTLNIRKGPGTNYTRSGFCPKGVFTIVAESNGVGATRWGKLKSGAGWISLDYTKRVR